MAPHRGHLFDAERTAEPPYIHEPLPIQASTWARWVRPLSSGTYDSGLSSLERSADQSSAGTLLLSSAALDGEFGSYSQTYDYEAEAEAAEQEKRAHHRRRQTLWQIFIEDPWVPGVIRIVMFALSCVTLGLGAKLTALNTNLPPYLESVPVCAASPIMAVALAALAIAYLPYIFYDEYFGGPVGIRSPLSKARLLFFDLTFVVMYTVNVTLAADEAFTNGCTDMYMLERAVFAFILVTIIAWIGTFSITLIRLIARIGAGFRSGRS